MVDAKSGPGNGIIPYLTIGGHRAKEAVAFYAQAFGAEVEMPLDNQFWGARYGKLRDPFGHVWSIGGPLKS